MAVVADGRRYNITTSFLPILLGMDANTAECMVEQLARIDHGGSDRELFPRKIRLALTDNASYNARTERHTTNGRVGWTAFRAFCHVHFDGGTFKRMNGHVSFDIIGMIHTTLARNGFGMMLKVRSAAAKVLDRLVYIYLMFGFLLMSRR